MDKKTINNEIVSMRSDANRAKVHVISKLNREIKHLRVVKDFHTETQKQKNAQKADRLVKEVLLIKKLKHDDISKFVLRHTKQDLTTMLSLPTTSTEYRCLCKLGLHKSLLSRVEKFHTQCPNWGETLTSLIASIGVKLKRCKVLAEQVAILKGEKTNEDEDDVDDRLKHDSDNTNSDEELESGNDNSDVQENLDSGQDDESDEILSEKESDDESSESDDCEYSDVQGKIKTNVINTSRLKRSLPKTSKSYDNNEEVCDINNKQSQLTKESNGKVRKIKNQINLNSESKSKDSDKHEPFLDTQQKKRKKLKEAKEMGEGSFPIEQKVSDTISISKHKDVKRKMLSNRSNEMKVVKFSQLLEIDTPSSEPLKEGKDEPPSAVSSKAVDPFFMGTDGKSAFLSTVVSKEPTVEKSTNERSQPVYDHLGRRLNRREIRAHLHGKKSFRKFTPGFSKNNYYSKKWVDHSTPTTLSQDSYSDTKFKVLPPPPEEKLHPSWEAKKKQKEQSNTVFLGKKIKFDD